MTNIQEFLVKFEPMHRTRVEKVLAVAIRLNGEYVTCRADLISSRIAAGSQIVAVRGERRLEMPNGVFLSQKSITSIGMDYAEFLFGAA